MSVAAATSARRGGSFTVPKPVRPVAVLVGAIALSEVFALLFGRHRLLPLSVIVDALARGGPEALFAVGLVLVYRAARIINFAHGSIATATAIVFLTLQAEGWPWLAVIATSLAGAVVTGVIVEVLLLRRFANAPRLVVTVVTIGVGQIVVALAGLLPSWRFGLDISGAPRSDQVGQVPTDPATSPFTHYHHDWAPVRLTGDHLFVVVVTIVVVLALAAFFRRSNAGIAIRGAAENGEKAAVLGIGTGVLSSFVWAMAAGLAGLAAVLSGPLSGQTLVTVGAGLGTAALLRGLAAAVIGRMEDLPLTFCAGIGIAVLERAVFFTTTHGQTVDVVLLAVLGVALFLQRRTAGRVDASISTWAAAEEIRAVPKILASHAAVRTGKRWVVAGGLIVLLGYPFAMSPSQVFLGGTFAIYGIVVVSLVVLTGWGGQISLGHFALAAVGAAAGGALLGRGWPFPVALLVGSLAGALVAVVLGLPALRVRGLFLAVTTLGFAVVMAEFVLDPHRFPSLVPQSVPRPRLLFLNGSDERVYYFICLAGLAVAVAVAQGLRRTRTGRVLIAMRDNERAAQALGLSIVRVRLMTFAISGFLAAFAGVLYASHSHAVRPDAFGPERSLDIFLMAVIGGLGSVSGVLTGAVYLGLVQLLLPNGLGQLLASGAGVLLVLLFYPAGLGGGVYALRDAFLRRIALRDKIFVPSLVGDLRAFDGEQTRAPLLAKVESGPSVTPVPVYTLESDIADAGTSQRGKGWVYG